MKLTEHYNKYRDGGKITPSAYKAVAESTGTRKPVIKPTLLYDLSRRTNTDKLSQVPDDFHYPDSRSWGNPERVAERMDIFKKGVSLAQYAPVPLVKYPAMALNTALGSMDTYQDIKNSDRGGAMLDAVSALPLPDAGFIKSLGPAARTAGAARVTSALNVVGTTSDLTNNFGRKKKYDTGGIIGMTLGGVQQLGTGIVDAIAKPNDLGNQSTGAMVAKGFFSGGVAGAAAGLLKGFMLRKQEYQTRKRMAQDALRVQDSYSEGAIGADPGVINGYQNSSMYRDGGPIKVDRNVLGEWNKFIDYVGSRGMKGSADLNARDKNMGEQLFMDYRKSNPATMLDYSYVKPVQEAIAGYRNKAIGEMKSGKAQVVNGAGDNYEHFMEGLSDADGWFGSKTSSWKFPSEYLSTYSPEGKLESTKNLGLAKMRNGGSLVSLSGDTMEVNGAAHEQGGVQIPGTGAEVEGGETMKGNFVFSKELGFAALHKPLAKTIGKVEAKPQTQERRNTLLRLKQREEALAKAQEAYKQINGMQ